MIDTRDFLDAVSGYTSSTKSSTSADRPVRLGTIDQYYTSGLATVVFDGDTSTSAKGYAWVTGYSPVAGDRVYLVPVGQGYIIGGKIQTSLAYNNFYTLSLQNGWVNFDPSYYTPARVTKTASGMVHVSAMIKSGTATPGTVIATLPQPFRPRTRASFLILSAGQAAGVDVNVDGTIVCGSGVVAGTNYTSLDNISFQTDPSLVWNNIPSFSNGWTAYSPELTPAYTKDSMGRVWFRGAVKNTTTPAADTVIFNVPAGYRAYRQQHHVSYTASTFGNLDAGDTGDIRYKANGGNVGYIFLRNLMYHEGSIGPWTNATMLNGWVANSANQPDASYYKDSEGIVYLRGLIRAGTIGAAAFTLPPGYRPSKTMLRATNSINAIGRLDIQSDGMVVPVAGSNIWFSLDGIQFSAEG